MDSPAQAAGDFRPTEAIGARAARLVRRHGTSGAAKLVARRLLPATPHSSWFLWYELLIAAERPRHELAPGLALRAAKAEDVHLLDQLPANELVSDMDPSSALRRMEEGATLWLVTEGDRLAFACWIFRGHAPVWAARGGEIELPPDVVCLEDSHSSPAFQGRGIAPATWTLVADRCGEEGARAIVTKITEGNAASRRAVEKIAFRAVARMHMSRRDWRMRVDIELLDEEPSRRWLTSLTRG